MKQFSGFCGRRFASIDGLVDWVLPPRCLKCLTYLADSGLLCGACWPLFTFLRAPYCSRCGLPFELEVLEGTVCGKCLKDPPLFTTARSSVRYDDVSKDLLLRFKYGDDTSLAYPFARWIMGAAADLLTEADLLIPVPLHWTRLWKRQYNQAALLAKELAKLSGKSYAPHLLHRHRRTLTQGKFSFQERKNNVIGAFTVKEHYASDLRHKKVVLVDDVIASGATGTECSKILKKQGVTRVDLVSVARVF